VEARRVDKQIAHKRLIEAEDAQSNAEELRSRSSRLDMMAQELERARSQSNINIECSSLLMKLYGTLHPVLPERFLLSIALSSPWSFAVFLLTLSCMLVLKEPWHLNAETFTPVVVLYTLHILIYIIR